MHVAAGAGAIGVVQLLLERGLTFQRVSEASCLVYSDYVVR